MLEAKVMMVLALEASALSPFGGPSLLLSCKIPFETLYNPNCKAIIAHK
jgi:hypothetical protein